MTMSIRPFRGTLRIVGAGFTLAPLMGVAACGGGGDDSGGDSASECPAQEAQLSATTWITPEHASPEKGSTSYNLTTFHPNGGVDVEMHDSGYTQNVVYEDWAISSTATGWCDKIIVMHDGAWLAEYSRIVTLTSCNLEIEATDGTHYGAQTKYASTAPACGNNGPTCGNPCTDTTECDGDELCLYEGYVGSTCLPAECKECNDQGHYCHLSYDPCALKECSPFLAP